MANGTYPVEYGTPVGLIRLLIPDTATQDGTVDTDYLFSDDQIEAVYAFYGDNVKRATAALLDVIANDQALLYKSVRTDDLTVDGTKVAAELRKRAEGLRAEADVEDNGEVVDSFEIVYPQRADGGFIPEGTQPIWGREYGVGRWR